MPNNKPTPWSLRASLAKWTKGWLQGGPHFVVGNQQLLRWYIIPRNPLLNIYLHKFQKDDEDRALHDHPWWFVSWIIKGRYTEITSEGAIDRHVPSVAFRPAVHAHRVMLWREFGEPVPCWTIVVTGQVTRTWGFWCPKGFMKWYDFLAKDDYGQTGRGCGEHA